MCKVWFAYGMSWYSWIIRLILQSDINHVYMTYILNGVEWAIEIDGKGVRLAPSRMIHIEYNQEKTSCVELDIDPVVLMTKSHKYLGKKYDWKGLFSALFKLLSYKLFGIEDYSYIGSRNKYFCSEFVASILIDCGYLDRTVIRPDLTSPEDLRRLLNGLS